MVIKIIRRMKKKGIWDLLSLLIFHLKLILYFKFKFFIKYISNGFKTKKILFYPGKPWDQFVIYKICHFLGYSIINTLNKKPDLAMSWCNNSFRAKNKEMENISQKIKVINLKCNNISKRNVENIFEKTFGYSLSINPRTFQDKCVIKPNEHLKAITREIIQCPIKKLDKKYSYQKIIDSTNDKGLLVNMRVPIFLDEIPFVYLRFRSQDEKLLDTVSKGVKIIETKEVFSEKEIKNILSFCSKLGMDYGEIDILRDKKNKKIYIVDANTTPFGPHGLPRKITNEAMKRLADCFRKKFV